MDIQFCPAPTAAETKTLASLPSAAPLKYERVHEVLEEILSFCRRPDIHGFLFTPEPIQVSHFLKPDILDGTFTGVVHATRVDPGNEINHAITDHSTGSFVLYPAFVSQNLSFGFAVNTLVYSPVNTWDVETGFSYKSELRYVRDNERKALLSVADAEEVGLMQFQYTRQISTTCQFRTVACFARKDFKTIIQSNHVGARDILSAMFHMHTGLEYRLCPLCTAPHGECECELPNYEPKHPFDKEVVMRNIQMHLGSYEGSASVAFLSNGRFSQSASVGSRVTFRAKFDRELAERLRRWVLKRHCGPQHPLQSLFFSTSDQNDTRSSLSIAGSKEDGEDEGIMKTLSRSCNQAGSAIAPQESYGYLSELLGAMGTRGLEESDTTSGLTNIAVAMQEVRESSARSSAEGRHRDAYENYNTQASTSPRWRQAVKSDSDLDEIQKMKEERRKEQNRVSARKSNQKKKAFNDALKSSLKETHARAAALRARELQLRRENLDLRKRLEG